MPKLTEQVFEERLRRIIDCRDDETKWEYLCDRLKEKGVEYCVVMPLFEVVLGFDPLEDMKMEHGGEEYNSRLDFAITVPSSDYAVVIEAKSLKETNLKTHENQLNTYLTQNDNYPWGILTNGIEWRFYVTKRYLEYKFNEGHNILFPQKVINFLNISISDPSEFLEIMKCMKRESMKAFLENTARFVYIIISGSKGRPPVIQRKKKLDALIKEKIRELVDITKGDYWDAINSGKLSPESKVVCKNALVELVFTIDDRGRLVLDGDCVDCCSTRELYKKYGKEAVDVIIAWQGSTNVFVERKQVVSALTNRRRVTNHLMNEFPFHPEP